MLRVAVVGCGHVAVTEHIPSLIANPLTQLVSVCDVDAEKVRKISESFGIPRYYQKVSQMLDGESLDLVHVCTPPSTHLEVAMRVLEARTHVLIEKPFVLKVEEADQLIVRAGNVNRKISVVHNYLFSPVMLDVKRRVWKGEIGQVVSVQALWGRKTDYYREWFSDLPGGWFGEIMPHLLYLILAFAGDVEVKTVTPIRIDKETGRTFDELQTELVGEETLGFFSLTANCLRSNILILSGTRATLFIDVENNMLHEIPLSPKGYPRKAVREMSYFAKTRIRKLMRRMIHPQYGGIVNSSHYHQINSFAESIIGDHEPPVTPEQAKAVVKTYQQIWDFLQK